MHDCLHSIRSIEFQFGTCLAEFGAELGCCDDGDGEDLGGFEEFLRRVYHGGVVVDCFGEFLLEVADTESRLAVSDVVACGSQGEWEDAMRQRGWARGVKMGLVGFSQ